MPQPQQGAVRGRPWSWGAGGGGEGTGGGQRGREGREGGQGGHRERAGREERQAASPAPEPAAQRRPHSPSTPLAAGMGLSPAAPQAGGDKRHWQGQKGSRLSPQQRAHESAAPRRPAQSCRPAGLTSTGSTPSAQLTEGQGLGHRVLPFPVGRAQHQGAPAPQETSPPGLRLKQPPLLSPGSCPWMSCAMAQASILVAPWGQSWCCPHPAPCRVVLGCCSQAPGRIRPPASAQYPWARDVFGHRRTPALHIRPSNSALFGDA